MRVLIAGILLCLLPTVAIAQAKGQVESVGFAGAYRPGCWTPMVVQLVPTTGGNFNGRIEVVQEDLDRDTVLFTRQVNLTGNPANGAAADQRFWMYFVPQPSKDRELDASKSTDELTQIIRVRLVSEAGKELFRLPITSKVNPVETLRGGMGAGNRGTKLVLCVNANNLPSFNEYAGMTGLTEDLAVAGVRKIASELPDSVIGYDAVDAIVWTDADPTELSAEQLAALEEFVRRGGRLVLSQETDDNEWQRNGVAFPLLSPVVVKGVERRDDKLETLRQIARVPQGFATEWDRLKGPFKYAVAQPRPGAIVAEWQHDEQGNVLFDETGQPKPYIVRHAVGAGSVTWVAQDLGDPQVKGDRFTPPGWCYVWDAVMDWRNEPVPAQTNRPGGEAAAAPYKSNISWELGKAYLGGMDLPSTSAALIGIAVLFFIAYWVAAGPGSYFVLLRRNRASMSWFTFAVMALAATGLTVLIVKLVLRGAPRLQHVSFVRSIPNEPARVHSQFGLYIPRDGAQTIELKNAAPNRTAYVTAFNLHPAFNQSDIDFPARQEYRVPVKTVQDKDQQIADPKSISVPYRSTLKKFQAEWAGDLKGSIDGDVKLAADMPQVRGRLTNNTGRDLRSVYLVVNHPAVPQGSAILPLDHVLYVGVWRDGETLDLDKEFKPPGTGGAPYIRTGADLVTPTNQGPPRYKGTIQRDLRNAKNQTTLVANWTDHWFDRWRSSTFGDREWVEEDPLAPRALPLLAFYDRLPVARNTDKRDDAPDRFDVLRRSLRHLDLSSAVSGGQLAIAAVVNNREEPLPIPLEVEGDPVSGKGVVYRQFVLPVDRSAVNKPPTPATQPAPPQPVQPAEPQ